MKNHSLFIAMSGIVLGTVFYALGYEMGRRKEHIRRTGVQNFAWLIHGIGALNDIQAGDFSSVEKRIRLQSYIEAMKLMETEYWKDHYLVQSFSKELFEITKPILSFQRCLRRKNSFQ